MRWHGPRGSSWNSLQALGPVLRLAIILRSADQHTDGTWTLRCAWCRCTLGREVEIDHLWPRSRGGRDHPENLVPSCPECNDAPEDRDVPLYVRAQALLPITRPLRKAAREMALGWYPWFAERAAKNRLRQRDRDARRREMRAQARNAA